MLKVAFQQITGIFWSFVNLCQFIPNFLPKKKKGIFLYIDGAVRMDDQNSARLGKGPGTKPWETILPLPLFSAPIPPVPRVERLLEVQLLCLLQLLYEPPFLEQPTGTGNCQPFHSTWCLPPPCGLQFLLYGSIKRMWSLRSHPLKSFWQNKYS